jgi:hypothetical protein
MEINQHLVQKEMRRTKGVLSTEVLSPGQILRRPREDFTSSVLRYASGTRRPVLDFIARVTGTVSKPCSLAKDAASPDFKEIVNGHKRKMSPFS